MCPRFTPSRAISAAMTHSAPRKIVPSPPSTTISSMPVRPARPGGATASPVGRVADQLEITAGPGGDEAGGAQAPDQPGRGLDGFRRPMWVSTATVRDCDGTSWLTCDSIGRWLCGSNSAARAGPSGRARGHDRGRTRLAGGGPALSKTKNSRLPPAPCRSARYAPLRADANRTERRPSGTAGLTASRCNGGITDDATLAQQPAPDLELGLDHQQHLTRAGWVTSRQRLDELRQRDEGDVGHHEVHRQRRPPVPDRDHADEFARAPRGTRGSLRKNRCQLVGTDINGVHRGPATLEENLGETASRGTGVERSAGVRTTTIIDTKIIEGTDQLVRRRARRSDRSSARIWAVGSTSSAGLVMITPSTDTEPELIMVWAWLRDRARPRAASSRSRRWRTTAGLSRTRPAGRCDSAPRAASRAPGQDDHGAR